MAADDSVEIRPDVFRRADELTPDDRKSADRLRAEMDLMADQLADKMHRLAVKSGGTADPPSADTLLPRELRTYWKLRLQLLAFSMWLGEISKSEVLQILTDRTSLDVREFGDLERPRPTSALVADFEEKSLAAEQRPGDVRAWLAFLEAHRRLNARAALEIAILGEPGGDGEEPDQEKPD